MIIISEICSSIDADLTDSFCENQTSSSGILRWQLGSAHMRAPSSASRILTR
jgi:hypothetical protein